MAVRVARVNPVYRIVYNGALELRTKNEERTAVRFSIRPDGSVGEFNTLQKQLVSF